MADTSPSVRVRWSWALSLLALSVALAAAAEAHGRSARRTFAAPGELGGARWGTVAGAGDALRAWVAAGVRGRRLVVFTGRWTALPPAEADRLVRGADEASTDERVDDDTALLLASRWGIARRLVVVMPPPAWRDRVEQLRAVKGFELTDGCASAPFMGLQRQFCLPEALPRSGEPALVLVEPSYFGPGGGAPAPPVSGLDLDLGLVAETDPRATEPARARARDLAASLSAVQLETGR